LLEDLKTQGNQSNSPANSAYKTLGVGGWWNGTEPASVFLSVDKDVARNPNISYARTLSGIYFPSQRKDSKPQNAENYAKFDFGGLKIYPTGILRVDFLEKNGF
jgi:hypothetical protein